VVVQGLLPQILQAVPIPLLRIHYSLNDDRRQQQQVATTDQVGTPSGNRSFPMVVGVEPRPMLALVVLAATAVAALVEVVGVVVRQAGAVVMVGQGSS
jgi:hypothetical protein